MTPEEARAILEWVRADPAMRAAIAANPPPKLEDLTDEQRDRLRRIFRSAPLPPAPAEEPPAGEPPAGEDEAPR